MKIGIDLGGSHIAIGVVTEDGKIVEKLEKRLTEIEKRDLKKSIENYIIDVSKNFMKKYEVKSIGIAMPGTAINGYVLNSGNLKLEDYNLAENLQKEINIPITIRNDAKCAAIAEKNYGCLKGYERSIFLTLGTGIGGAAFLDNNLLKAGNRPAFEFGHMVIQKDGIQCSCGRKGCFERYASMKAFKNNLRNALGVDENTRGQELLEMIRNNKPGNENYDIIEGVVSDLIDNLGLGIVNLINIFEPQIIGIGGSFVYFEDVFLNRLKQRVYKETEGRFSSKDFTISTAVMGNYAGIIGATLL